MKIAIVGPSPVPFTIGGVENALSGIQKYINQSTEHSCELIKIPVREDNFWNLIHAYRDFYNLDLSHFDAIISTKYPAWMTSHPNHICYMFHCLRGFYDTYYTMNMPEDVDAGQNSYILRVCEYIELSHGNPDIKEMFRLLDVLWENRSEIPSAFFAFPHPFIRKIIRYLDFAALSKINEGAFFSLSETVKKRTEYFPDGIDPKVLYLPSHLTRFHTDSYQYLFTISRLDAPKRIDLIIKSMKYVESDINLIIAGRGPEEVRLKELAADDKRIKFVGFVNDDALVDYYANALAVVFVPFDEDYGLITIESMMSHKPVITCSDSGGTTEFIEHSITGYIAEPNAKSLGKMMNLIAGDKEKSIEMGNKAYQKVQEITWKSTVDPLLESIAQGMSSGKAARVKIGKKITVTSSFSIYPPKGGGQSRTYNLYKNLARSAAVEIVSLGNNSVKRSRREIAPNMIENIIPRTIQQAENEWSYEKYVGCPVSDTALPFVSHLTPEYAEALRESIEDSDIVVLSHPYLYHEAKKYLTRKVFVYEAQDVEYLLKKTMYKNNNKCTRDLLESVRNTEAECSRQADYIITCTEEDKNSIVELYDVSADKIIVAANGVDCTDIHFISQTERNHVKEELGLKDEKIALFVGSWHQPNIEAVEFILNQAKLLPDVKFIIAGSVCNAFEKAKIPSNVGLFGVFGEGEKALLYKSSDIALNPMFSGSGTNLKMFDYMASGIPVVSSAFGTRGIPDKSAIGIFRTQEEFIPMIRDRVWDENDLFHARKMVEEHFDWKKIVENLKLLLV